MHGDDAPLDRLKAELTKGISDLRREMQEATGAIWARVEAQGDRQSRLDGRLDSISTMIEDRHQH